MIMSLNILVMYVVFVLLYKLNKGFFFDVRQRLLKIGFDVYKYLMKIKNLWYFYYIEMIINLFLLLYIYDVIIICISMIVLLYFLFFFDLESRVGGLNGN